MTMRSGTSIVDALTAWLAELPLDGTETTRTRELETQISGLLESLDAGNELDQRQAAGVRELMSSVDQRRASRRGEN